MTDTTATGADGETPEEPTRRDFIHVASGAFAAGGVAFLAWPFIDQMNPAADTRAASAANYDLNLLSEGSEARLLIGGKPVFVRHRTASEIAAAQRADESGLKDPETDDARLRPGPDGALRPQFLIMFGSCTHLGCVPTGDGAGDFGGWYCPCHGSHYDTSGRIRKGPAPTNLPIPNYEYVTDSVVKISL